VSRLAPMLLCLALAGCAATSALPSSSPGASETRRAADRQGSFTLAFELPRLTWRAGEAISGTATLSLANGAADVSGSGSGLIGFDFAEVGGSRHVEPAQTADCRPYRLEADRPIGSGILKSGGFYPEQPNFEFYRSFLADPIVRLPAGEWTITALARFSEGKGCTGQSRAPRALIRVTITP
jgi:hypothetical protein